MHSQPHLRPKRMCPKRECWPFYFLELRNNRNPVFPPKDYFAYFYNDLKIINVYAKKIKNVTILVLSPCLQYRLGPCLNSRSSEVYFALVAFTSFESVSFLQCHQLSFVTSSHASENSPSHYVAPQLRNTAQFWGSEQWCPGVILFVCVMESYSSSGCIYKVNLAPVVTHLPLLEVILSHRWHCFWVI